MTRLAALLLLCPVGALSADNPLLGRWRACHGAENQPYAEEFVFHDDGTALYSATTYTAGGCAGPHDPTRSRGARYSFLREENPDVLSFEFTSDHLNLMEDEAAWGSGYFTVLSSDRMSLRITDLIVIRGGKPVHISPEEISRQPKGVFTRVAGPRQSPAARWASLLAALRAACLRLLFWNFSE